MSERVLQESRVLLEQTADGRVRLRHVGSDDIHVSSDAGASATSTEETDPGDDGNQSWRGAVAQVRELERDALLASVALGQMQRYLRLCEQSELPVEVYRDDARARFVSDETGAQTAAVCLRPRLRFACADLPLKRATAIRLLNEAASSALWYDSPRVQVQMDPVFEFARPE